LALMAARVDVEIVDKHFKSREIGTKTAKSLLEKTRRAKTPIRDITRRARGSACRS
jgi:hypothetical protein